MSSIENTQLHTTNKVQVSIKSVAMPAEHGGWGFLFEPILLGILVAPSLAGVAIGLAAVGLFLLHQPLKIVIKDRKRGRVFQRTRLAQRFAIGYSAAAVGFGILAFLLSDGTFWLPPLLTAPLIAAQFYFEARNEGRSLWSEIFAAAALASIAPAIILAGGQAATTAAIAGLLMLLRLPSIEYVRTRIKWMHNKPASRAPTLITHIAAVAITAVLWAANLIGVAALIGTAMLLARAIYGLFAQREKNAKVIGIQEVFLGLAYAVLGAIGLG